LKKSPKIAAWTSPVKSSISNAQTKKQRREQNEHAPLTPPPIVLRQIIAPFRELLGRGLSLGDVRKWLREIDRNNLRITLGQRVAMIPPELRDPLSRLYAAINEHSRFHDGGVGDYLSESTIREAMRRTGSLGGNTKKRTKRASEIPALVALLERKRYLTRSNAEKTDLRIRAMDDRDITKRAFERAVTALRKKVAAKRIAS
jgi:hypothetical protein